jgi:hypothetical protein
MNSECPQTTQIIFSKLIETLRIKYSSPDMADEKTIIRMPFIDLINISKDYFKDISKISDEFIEIAMENVKSPYEFNIDIRICDKILKSNKSFKERFMAYDLIENIDYITLPEMSDDDKKSLNKPIYDDGLPEMQITLMTLIMICCKSKTSSSIGRALMLCQALNTLHQNYIRGLYKVKSTGKDAPIPTHYAVMKVKEPIEPHTEEYVFVSDTLEKLEKKMESDAYESIFINITEAKLKNTDGKCDAKVTVKNILKAIEVNFRKQISDLITRELSNKSKNSKAIIKEKTKLAVLPIQLSGTKVIIKDNNYKITHEDLKSFIEIECIEVIESGNLAYVAPEKKLKDASAKYTSEEVVATTKTLKDITSKLKSKKVEVKSVVKEELDVEDEAEASD